MWGFAGSPYLNRFGSGTRVANYTNSLPPAVEPNVFRPTDISDCVLWLDANDSSTINVNEDTSGNNVNRVMKWFDKAMPSNQNYYTHIGSPSGSGLYNTHTMNGLNTVYFEPYSAMNHQGGGVTYNFQARSFFCVIKLLTDLSGSLDPFCNIYNAVGVSGGMNTGLAWDVSGYYGSICENGITCGIQFHIQGDLLNNRMILGFVQSDTDLSGNVGTFDTAVQQLFSNQLAANYYTSQSQFVLNDSTRATAQDIAEIVMYGKALNTSEMTSVLDYLADKWNLSGPTGSGVFYQ